MTRRRHVLRTVPALSAQTHLRLLGVLVVSVTALAGCATTSGSSGSAPPVTAATAVASQSPSASPSPSPSVDVTGTWTGTWVRTTQPPGKGTYTVTLQQSGSDLTGTLVATGSACLTTHPVVGHLLGSLVSFHTTQGPGTGDWTGTLAASGTAMAGTGVVTCAAGVGKATWKLSKG